eukprot:7733361-Pyramimonas_sp.AAC.1
MCTDEVPPAAEASGRTPYPTHAVRGYNGVKTDKSCADCPAKRNGCDSGGLHRSLQGRSQGEARHQA